jgi:hypothetical protein
MSGQGHASDNRIVGGGGVTGAGAMGIDRWLPVWAVFAILYCLASEMIACQGAAARPFMVLAHHSIAAVFIYCACWGMLRLGWGSIMWSLRMLLIGN